uniref:Coenzyme F420 hydrogenase/dehydrogenase, beta subunit C-terminal domain n=1 Tax=Prevotella sp. GTC17259 TaxID=3236795 RepID=A0AB33J794_9BACT
MNNVSDIKDCFGCGVCAVSCPKTTITIALNKNGFYEPVVDESRCIDCAICRNVCSFINSGLSLEKTEITSFASWSNDEDVRLRASSGGVGFEIGKLLINQGYKACGVRYNIDKRRAEHYIADNVEDYKASIGSKYIQSYTVCGLKSVNLKEKYLVTGTPCQIDSFRRYIRKSKKEDNFILMDFFCHGVPSMWMWENYLNINEPLVGKLQFVSWRNKKTGWHNSYAMNLVGANREIYSLMSEGDLFYRLFLGDWCMNPACVKNCKFKYKASSADIRIGDLWGETYKEDEKGVSAAIAFTRKGKEILDGLKHCTLKSHSFEVVAEGQMKKNAKNAILYPIAKNILNHGQNHSLRTWDRLARIAFLLDIPSIFKYKIQRAIKNENRNHNNASCH